MGCLIVSCLGKGKEEGLGLGGKGLMPRGGLESLEG